MPGNILFTPVESAEMPAKMALRAMSAEQERRIVAKQSNPAKLEALRVAHIARMKVALSPVITKPLINTLGERDDDVAFTLDGTDSDAPAEENPIRLYSAPTVHPATSSEEIRKLSGSLRANGGAGRSSEDPMLYKVTPAPRFFCPPISVSSKPTEGIVQINLGTAELITAEINKANKIARLEKLERQKMANEAKEAAIKTLSKEALLRRRVASFADKISFDGEKFILENFRASNKSGLGILSVFGFIDKEEEDGEVYLNKFSHLKIILGEINETWPAFSLIIDEDFEKVLEAETPIDLIGPHLVISADKNGIKNLYRLIREKVEDTYSSSINAVNAGKILSPEQKIHLSESLKKAFESISLTLDEFEAAALDYLKLFKRLAVDVEPEKIQSLIDVLNFDSESDDDPWLHMSLSPV